MTADQINNHLASGGRVMVAAYYRATVYRQKNAGAFVNQGDKLYVKRGRSYEYLGRNDRPLVAIRLY